jgi:glucans biosynthesis protein C
MRLERALLICGVTVPVFYYTALVGTSLFWPGYSHVTQYASELGSAASPRPWLFNGLIIAAGAAAMLASVGFFVALKHLGGTLPAFLAGLAVFLWGVSFVMGGSFPMPDPRHGAFGLALAMHLAPPFMLWALAGKPMPRVKLFLVLVFVVSGALILIMFDVGGLHLVRRANVGLWQRAYSLSAIPWIGIVAWVLLRVRSTGLSAGALQEDAQ